MIKNTVVVKYCVTVGVIPLKRYCVCWGGGVGQGV